MRRRTFLLGSLATAGLSAAGGCTQAPRGLTEISRDDAVRRYGDVRLARSRPPTDAPNVVFISLDDCNDWLGFLNDHPGTYTPNLDALASESLVFDHAYTAAPMCLPARTAVMFGRPPYETDVYDHSDASRAAYAAFQRTNAALVDAFWAAGYDTHGVGKSFHDRQADRWTSSFDHRPYVSEHLRDEPKNAGRFDPGWRSPYDGEPIGTGRRSGPIDFGPSGETPERDPDGRATAWVIERIREDRTRPFFIGHGVSLPHEPWRVPQEFLDLHPLDQVVVPELRPEDLDDLGPYARDEILGRDYFRRLYESGVWHEAVQAYQAAISYADWCVGQVLDALRSGPRGDDTVVAVWSDHGFHLGEKLHLHKFTLWERATHVPLVLHVPGRFDRAPRVDPPVSLLDLGPTLEDLCAVDPLPHQRGASLLPVVDDEQLAERRPPVMTWLEGNHAVRHGTWRYIRYRTGETELYDLATDPDELHNLAGDPAQAARLQALDELLPAPPG